MSASIRPLRLVARCLVVAVVVSAITGGIASVVVAAAVAVARYRSDLAGDVPTGILLAVELIVVGGFLGAVLAAVPTFLAGFAMTLLSLDRPTFRRPLAWLIVGGASGFLLTGLFPADHADASLELVRAFFLPLLGMLDAFLFRRWVLPKGVAAGSATEPGVRTGF